MQQPIFFTQNCQQTPTCTLLRVQFTKPPPVTVYTEQSFPITVTVTDDLGTHTRLEVPFKVRLKIVNADTYEDVTELQVALDKPEGIVIPVGGPTYISVQITIHDRGLRKNDAQHRIRILLEVDERQLTQQISGSNTLSEGMPAFFGSNGVCRSDDGVSCWLPLRVYSGSMNLAIRGSSESSGKVSKAKLQTCERHFFLRLAPDAACRLPIIEHAHMTFSTGTHVWDCSPLLANYLICQRARWLSKPRQSTVLELGAGCGLVGITGAILGANVVSTDMEDIIEETLTQNIAASQAIIASSGKGGKIKTEVLEWGRLAKTKVQTLLPPESEKQRILVVAADVLYNLSSHDVFLETLVSLTLHRPAADVLIAYKKRGPGEERFLKIARQHFVVQTVEQCWGITIFWLRPN